MSTSEDHPVEPKRAQSEEEEEEKKPKLLCSVRLGIAFVCGIAMFNISYVRVGLSMALICMSNSTRHQTAAQQEQVPAAKYCEFNWSSATKGFIMSSAFYGFIVGPIIAGYLSFKYGGKIIMVVGTICTGATYFPVPEAARASPILFASIRVFSGLFSSMTFPAFYDILSHWVVPEERQLLIGGGLWGIPLASILNFPINTFICHHLGWVWIFYILGTWIVCCGFTFIFTTFDHPDKCSYISAEEREYLNHRIPQTSSLTIPWKKILSSLPVYAYIIMHFCMNYVYLSIIMFLPLLMEDVYLLSLQENGVLSATPFLGSLLMRVLLSFFFEKLREKLKLSKNSMRKIFISIGTTLVSIALMVTTFLTAAYRYWALVCFIISTSGLELCITGGYLLSILDLCPSYVNVVTGVANSIGNTAGLICPLVTGWITVQGTREEWNIVFYVTIGVMLVSTAFYLVFGKNHLLYWGLATLPQRPPIPRASMVN